MWLFALFLIVPLVEIGLFIQVGGWLGLWPTLGIVVLTALLGTVLVRRQGAAELARLRGSFARLDDPTRPLAHGAMILASGLLLLTPGFFTDAVGFALLVPGLRDALMRAIGRRVRVERFRMGPAGHPAPGRAPRAAHPRDAVVEGEWEEAPRDETSRDETSRDGARPDEDAPRRPSGWTRDG